MIGGTVIHLSPGADTTRVLCEEHHGDRAAIYVRVEDEMPQVGDSLWWQGDRALWTPADGRFQDRHLVKVGVSFRPAVEDDHG